MKKIIEIATAEIGYTETPANSNKTKFGEWFGYDGVPWCGMFVSWVYAQAGYPLGNIGFLKGFAGCQTAVAHFKKTGEITENPVPGDIVFFDWNKDGRYDHTGILVEITNNGSIRTIEGNTSFTNQSNGGQVMKRSRMLNEVDMLFVHSKVLDEKEVARLTTLNEILRRNRLDLNTPAEKAIYDAIQKVEKVGAHPRLTDVIIMLRKAKELLADYVDGKIK